MSRYDRSEEGSGLMLVDSNNTNKLAGSFKKYIITTRSNINFAKIFKSVYDFWHYPFTP